MIKKIPDWKIVGLEKEKIFAQEYRDSFICFLLFSNPLCILSFTLETLNLSRL